MHSLQTYIYYLFPIKSIFRAIRIQIGKKIFGCRNLKEKLEKAVAKGQFIENFCLKI